MHQSLTHWQKGQDIWVYGYASLIWRPEFDFAEKRVGLLRGYHRSLCLWSRVNRGTPERPGLVFGLDAGGSCRGMAFRIPSDQVPCTMQALWKREMSTGSYHPRWLKCATQNGPVTALAFVMNRNTEAYVRGLTLDQLASIVTRAHGRCGPCTEYVLETARALRQCNILDRRLQILVDHLHHAMQAA
jgi:cation transport protein ChaC